MFYMWIVDPHIGIGFEDHMAYVEFISGINLVWNLGDCGSGSSKFPKNFDSFRQFHKKSIFQKKIVEINSIFRAKFSNELF